MKLPLILLCAALATGNSVSCRGKSATPLSYRVIAEHPHDPACYTQGLEFRNEKLLESSGGYGTSDLRETEPATGAIIRRRPFAPSIFAEGITVLGGELFCLSWKEKTAIVLEPGSFRFLRSHTYESEGWGITNDGKNLIMSDGTSTLRFIAPQTFKTLRTVEVTDDGVPVPMLNELEFSDGGIWANVYLTGKILRIDPADGKVTGRLDLSALRGRLAGAGGNPEVLNGIAKHPETGRFWVTGKRWPKMFEIEIFGGR